MTPPPRSIMAGAAVRVSLCRRPVALRFMSAAVTAEAVGLTSASPPSEPLLQAASAPAPTIPAPASRMERRLMPFMVLLSSVS
jgi:hypothetical protein